MDHQGGFALSYFTLLKSRKFVSGNKGEKRKKEKERIRHLPPFLPPITLPRKHTFQHSMYPLS